MDIGGSLLSNRLPDKPLSHFMTLLSDIPVLLIDCQATGPASAGGQLLELGWLRIAAADAAGCRPEQASALRLRLPEGETIPRQVQRVTGIGADSVSPNIPPVEAWQQMTGPQGAGPVPAVIHYARFERPFLRRLHEEATPGRPFPLEIVCTHEIVRRLLPELPRKGLRAVAGYFNHGVAQRRRSADHVAATARIWRHLCRLLAETAGVDTWPKLLAWLQQAPVPPSCRRFPMDRHRLDVLPDRPGVYRMRRATGDLLYIGKARSLRRRVISYFRPRGRHPEHILEMLTQARDLDVRETETALAAAIREADEIGRKSPPYNRALRTEGKSLAFVSADFARTSAAPSGDCLVGPLPGCGVASALSAIARICARTDGLPGALQAVVDLSPGGPPADRIVSEGVDLFLSRHGSVLLTGPTGRAMMKTARMLWLEKMASAQDGQIDKEDEVEESASAVPEWTPERVAGRLEGSLRHGGRMIRRARWFGILSESSLSWSPQAGDPRRRHGLVVQRGAVAGAGRLDPGSPAPVPPGYRTPVPERRAQFDPAAYQRMRVVTTEIRRLLAENRDPVLRISERVMLGAAQLERVLFWV